MPNYLSKNAKSILLSLLNKDPTKRPTMNQLKKDPYFEGIDWEKLAAKKYKPPMKLGKPDKSISGQKEDLASIFHDSITSSSAVQDAQSASQAALKKIGVFTDTDYTETNKNFNRVRNYSFVREKRHKK